MISFWLLCWKLLRATAGLRRNTPELTDGNQDDSVPSNSIPINSSLTPTHVAEPVTMETSSSPLLPEKKTDQLTSSCGQEAKEHHYPEGRGLREEDKNEKGEEEDDDHRDQEETKERELDEGCLILELKEREGGGGDRKQVSMEHGQGERDDLSDGHLSDGHLGDGHLSDGHLSDGHLSDCLQAELAIVTSDSDAGDDQWVSSASHEVTVRYVKGKGTQDGVCSTEREEGEGEEEERGEEQEEERKDEEKEGQTEAETQREESDEDLIEARDHLEDQRKPMRDVLPRSPSVSSSSSSTDTDRKLPADFCVLQEWSSENVFTEHLDFLLARQQWRKMEDEDKGKPLPQPSGRSQRSVQGTHSALYPPTRSPRLQHREVHHQPPRETPLSSTLSPSSEDSGLDESSYRSPLEETESAVEREIRLTLEREERHRRERGVIAQGLTIPRPASLKPGRSPPRPPACRTPTLSISPSPSPSLSSSSLPRSAYHEMTANNVIILEPDSSHSASRTRLLTPGGFSDWSLGPDAIPSTDVIVVETSNLIIRSASEFCLSSIPVVTETQESTFSSNPFFKLRSISSQSLVDQEIRMVRQREEEWRRQREEEWRRRRERERYDTVLVSPGLSDNISYNVSAVPDRSVSSPSSPSRTRKMERSSMSCDHKFPPALSTLTRRQNAMAQRWEANLLANQKKE